MLNSNLPKSGDFYKNVVLLFELSRKHLFPAALQDEVPAGIASTNLGVASGFYFLTTSQQMFTHLELNMKPYLARKHFRK